MVWNPAATIVVEIASPGDESYAKLPFYAAGASLRCSSSTRIAGSSSTGAGTT